MAYWQPKHSKDIGQIMFKLFIETRKMFTIEKLNKRKNSKEISWSSIKPA